MDGDQQLNHYLEKRQRILKRKTREDDIPPAADLGKYLKADNSSIDNSTSKGGKPLKNHLAHTSHSRLQNAVSSLSHDALLLPTASSSSGLIETSTPLERTWKATQEDIATAEGVGAGVVERNSLDLSLNFGPYDFDWSRNGRWLLLGGRRGHLATLDAVTKNIGCEIHVKETTKAVRWLHNQTFFAAAQKKYVYIYDHQGVEVHQLRNHVDVNNMEFLPYHFLLATIGNSGYLKYQDTSTGDVVAEHRTKLGKCHTMTQNRHNAFIHLGHTNGTVTLWSPSVSRPQVKLLAHLGPVSSIAIDSSTEGHYMATGGLDGSVKVWDMRKWDSLTEWKVPKSVQSMAFSGKGLLAIAWGKTTHVYNDTTKTSLSHPPLYMSELFPSTPLTTVSFRPFEDVLGVGHSSGFKSLVIPGSAEFNLDSGEADPYETREKRREREVKAVLEKLQPDMITLDAHLMGKLDPTARTVTGPHQSKLSFARKTRFDRMAEEDDRANFDGTDDEGINVGATTRIKKVLKQSNVGDKGRKKSLKRYLKRRKADVITKETEAIKAKIKERKALAEERRTKALAASELVDRTSMERSGAALARFQRR
ncbi:WD40 repeat-like protein [Atractiella rhizophila]|nr:WD40 repeat-like protein [Atractiella rhizophila]